MRYLLTMVDRTTHWPEAVPLAEITALSVAQAFFSCWIARFGTPQRITTDQGRQFEADLFHRLAVIMGIRKQRTTAYHPQANGCVERWHRSLKAALMAQLNSTRWTQVLPTVLLGLRAVFREDMGASVAEAVYGQPLRLPGDFLEDTPNQEPCGTLAQLKEDLARLKPSSARTVHYRKTFQHKDLSSCSHAFLREDAVRKPLQPPYSGPHKIIKRSEKVYTLRIGEKEVTVSLDRLKPAYILTEEPSPGVTPPRSEPQQQKPNQPPTPVQNSQAGYTTRSGRIVKKKVSFCDSITKGGSDVAVGSRAYGFRLCSATLPTKRIQSVVS